MKLNLKSRILEWRRVLQVARKPGKDEFIDSSKKCIIGIALIGAVGFSIFLLFGFLGI